MGQPYVIGSVAFTAAALGLLGGCREANTFAPPPPPAVTVATPVRDEVVVYLDFAGRMAPAESVEVRARVAGVLEKIFFEEGTAVEAGTPLYEIERAPYEAALEAAKAQLARVEAELAEAKFDLDKVQELISKGVASPQELVMAQAKHDSAVAARAAARADVKQAELNLNYTSIAAPIAGRVNQSEADVGNLVGQGSPTLLTTIVPWHPIQVYFTVGERDLLEVRRRIAAQGTPERDDVAVGLRLADGTDYPLAGRIDYADNRVDPATGTIRVRAVFDNPEEVLVPGMFGRVRIAKAPREALLIPEVALQRDMVGYYLLTVNAENVVERRNVEVAERVGTVRVITAGIGEAEAVIINGLQRVRPGAKVAPAAGTFGPEREEVGSASMPTRKPPIATAPSDAGQSGDE